MWRETKLLLIDDNLERRRDLSVILNFLGEDHLACGSGDWRKVVEQIDSSRSILGVLLGEVQLKGGALDLLKEFAAWDEYLPVLMLHEHATHEWPEEFRRRVLATLELSLIHI